MKIRVINTVAVVVGSALVASACTTSTDAPTQPLTRTLTAAPVVEGATGTVRVMPVRGAAVAPQATGILYHGGPILAQTKLVLVYWASSTIYAGGPAPGTTGTGAQDNSLVGYFARNLGGSPYFNINTTYYDQVAGGHTVQNSVTYTQYWADNTSVPPANGTPVSDATIQAEITKGLNSGVLVYDPQAIYAVFSNGNTNLGGGAGIRYCAYHGTYTWNGKKVVYAVQPYVAQWLSSCSNRTASPNNDVPADAVINVFAHEIEEATTDPLLDAWYDASGFENADKCAWNFGATYNNGIGVANMKIGAKDFLIQQNWVNSGNGGCLQSWTSGPVNQPPVARFTYTCTPTRVCTFDGRTSSDPDGTIASYAWKTLVGSVISTQSTWTKTFTSSGPRSLTLMVTDNNGASNSVTQTINVP